MARKERYQYKESSQAAVLCLALLARDRGECACFVVYAMVVAMRCSVVRCEAVVVTMSVVVDFEGDSRGPEYQPGTLP